MWRQDRSLCFHPDLANNLIAAFTAFSTSGSVRLSAGHGHTNGILKALSLFHCCMLAGSFQTSRQICASRSRSSAYNQSPTQHHISTFFFGNLITHTSPVVEHANQT